VGYGVVWEGSSGAGSRASRRVSATQSPHDSAKRRPSGQQVPTGGVTVTVPLGELGSPQATARQLSQLRVGAVGR
jgi:hypothetical protein